MTKNIYNKNKVNKKIKKIPISNLTVCINNRIFLERGKPVYKSRSVLKTKKQYQFVLINKPSFKTLKSKNKAKQPPFFVVGLYGLFIGFINGFFGGGGGMICVPVLTNIFKLEEKVAHATAIFIMLPLSLSSLIIYFLHGTLKENNLFIIITGFAIGAIIGALILKKMNNLVLKLIFSLIILAAGIRMLF